MVIKALVGSWSSRKEENVAGADVLVQPATGMQYHDAVYQFLCLTETDTKLQHIVNIVQEMSQ